MNFQQLRSVREATRQGFNLIEVAQALHTSQPGVSRQIRALEEELGIDIFVRAGKRLTGLTPPGAAVLPIIERLLQEAYNLQCAGEDFTQQDRGSLRIAATHSQARYALPQAVHEFSAGHPLASPSVTSARSKPGSTAWRLSRTFDKNMAAPAHWRV